ncbi:hypothetical protein DFH06DRAFT_1322700 [Mycena polygramma]|nr:hypothetical protein DFH06DRAFT_1322696 [Mycena polygramma]KAJ7666729.1 hypothetical protein DFH06DRAFT_1322700 [Mycena polygramma]
MVDAFQFTFNSTFASQANTGTTRPKPSLQDLSLFFGRDGTPSPRLYIARRALGFQPEYIALQVQSQRFNASTFQLLPHSTSHSRNLNRSNQSQVFTGISTNNSRRASPASIQF